MPTPGQSALKASLLAIFSNYNNTPDQAADQMATAINNHIKATTTTVTGTVISGAGAPGNIQGTGTI